MATPLHPFTRAFFRVGARRGAFGANHLGLRLPLDGGKLVVNELTATSFSASLQWPAWLCRADKRLCLAAALAANDELSTFAMGRWDKLHRPGVSVTLSSQLEAPQAEVTAGESLTFASSLIKGGHSLAWVHLEVWKGTELLATGRHLKFQPAGNPPGWSLMSYRPLRAIACAGVGYWVDGFPGANAPALLPSADASRRSIFGMSEEDRRSPEGGNLDGGHLLLADPVAAVSFMCALNEKHANPGASLHGGCATMLLAEAAAASYCKARGVGDAPQVQRISVSLPGAIGLSKPRQAHASAVTSASEDRSHAKLWSKPGQVAVEADMWW